MWKKAMGLKLVMALVLAVVTILVLGFFIKAAAKSTEKAEHNLRCKKAVELYSSSGGLQSFVEELGTAKESDADKGIDCPTQYIPVSETSSKDIMQKAAYELSHCWDNYGRGDLKVFQVEGTKFCSICSVLEFKHRNIVADGFVDYLATKEVPKDIPFRGEVRPTHLEFITKIQPTKDQIEAWEASNTIPSTIDTSADYASVYVFFKQSIWDKYKAAVHVGGGGAVVGAATVVGLAAAGVATGGIAPAAIVLGAALAGGGVGALLGDEPELDPWEAGVALVRYDAQSLTELGCEYIENR